MRIALLVFIGVLVSGPGRAQVINGESTYEDNYLHRPPAPAPDTASKKPAATEPNIVSKGRSHDDPGDPPPY